VPRLKRLPIARCLKQGAVAGESVGGLLEALPDRYYVISDFATKKGTSISSWSAKGDFDHRTKTHQGVVTKMGELLRDGHPFEEDFFKPAWAQSYSVRDLLAEKGFVLEIATGDRVHGR